MIDCTRPQANLTWEERSGTTPALIASREAKIAALPANACACPRCLGPGRMLDGMLADSTQKGLLERAIKRYIKRRRLDAGLSRPYLLVIQVGEDE
jgi:hypothetical protein